MKRMIKIASVLILCAVLLLAAFAAYKVYRHFEWNNYLLWEKLEGIESAYVDIRNDLYVYNLEYPLDVDHYSFDYSWLKQSAPAFIAHALGGIDGYVYTNSFEAMEEAYGNGFRIFEADIQLVDGEILLLHDLEKAADMCGFENGDFSSEDFLESDIYDRYTPMTWRDLMAFMAEHQDVYVVTDTKYDQQPYMSYVVSAMTAEAMEYDPAILDRVIVQIYSQHMLDVVMDIYPFKSVIYTLYLSPDDNERVKAFCAQSGVEAVTMQYSRFSEDFADALNAMGVYTLVHTINDAQQAKLLSESGVSGIYTDFLTPADFTK